MINNNYIYHYTNLTAFKGIVEKEEFWATEASYMNDENEIKYGMDKIYNILKELESKNISQDIINEIKKLINSDQYIFLLSFSLTANILPLWNRYDANAGVCLKIDLIDFQNSVRTPKPFIHQIPLFGGRQVLYDDNEIKKQLEYNLIKINDLYKNNKPSGIPALIAKQLLERFIYYLKHTAFKDEKEFRILLTINDKFKTNKCGNINKNIDFKQKNNILIPFIKVGFNKNAIKEIILGPLNTHILSRKSMRIFLDKNELDIKINSSGLPYRKF